MIRIDYKDFLKAVKVLETESNGGPLTVHVDGVVLKIKCLDLLGKELIIELSDIDYNYMPRKTRTETF